MPENGDRSRAMSDVVPPSDTMSGRYLAKVIAVSSLLAVLSLVLAQSDIGALLCIGIAFVTAIVLIVRAVARGGNQRRVVLSALAGWLLAATLLMTHYTLARDHLRWLFLSGVYKARVLAHPASSKQDLQHAEWDSWGLAVIDTTVFLVFDPTDSLAGLSDAQPPIRAHGLPCEVVRVRQLDRQWYAVLFYTDTYWGQGNCT
jgi:hypothetical protein